jgi:hypothetical protein
MATPTVILIGADKGGVGKTTVARMLLDYLGAQGIPMRAFDTEAPKGALHRFHPKISEIVDVAEIAGQMRIFDTVSDSSVTVVDVRRRRQAFARNEITLSTSASLGRLSFGSLGLATGGLATPGNGSPWALCHE